MKKILLALTLTLALFASACDSSTSVPIDPDAPEANITIISGDGLHAPSDTVQLSYSLANGQVRWATDSSDLISVDPNGIVSAKPRTAAIEIQPVIIQAQSNWAETGKITLYVGDYSYDESTGTYHIYSELGLNHWAQSENSQTAHAMLERDITLTEPADENGSNWTGISGYNATFDGQGHTIKGLKIIVNTNNQFYGFFRSITSGAAVKNLNLTDVYIESPAGYLGAIAGSSGGTIENCTVSGNGVQGRTLYVGGIAGYSTGDILNCTNNCNVTAYGQSPTVGGIVGYAKDCNITDCTNTKIINPHGIKDVKGGGIAGYIWGVTVDNCTNSGNIIGTNNASTKTGIPNSLCLGGIVGEAFGSNSIKNCTVAEGVAISASYYADVIDAEPSVNSILGNGTADPSNKGTATITKTDLSSSSTSTSP